MKIIIERDKNCVYCGNEDKLELDHIVPLKKGGNSLFNNFVLSCDSCNRSKSGKDVFKWCKEQEIEVPKIIIDLLNEQKKN
ncbi:MAG: HNH endonuclease [Atribacterota bacterium]